MDHEGSEKEWVCVWEKGSEQTPAGNWCWVWTSRSSKNNDLITTECLEDVQLWVDHEGWNVCNKSESYESLMKDT